MADNNNKGAAAPKDQGQKAAPVVGGKAAPTAHRAPEAKSLPTGCAFTECKKNIEKFGFCMEHYELYMAGVIRGDGRKPIDFEEKLARHTAKQQKRKVA